MHILISPNAFKNSLTAHEAAEAISKGFTESRLNCTCTCFAVGDGGDGTAELIIKHCQGETILADVHDPLGKPINASFGLIENGTTAVIEMANASGLRLLKQDELDPLVATSRGTGEQILAALDRGVQKVVIGMGGSATVDGATGILMSLGFRFLDDRGEELKSLPGDLIHLESIDDSQVDERVNQVEFVVLCDVDNLLLGTEGSAAVFGPQKGATPGMVQQLDAGLARLASVAHKHFDKNMADVKYGGTAGGAAAGLYAFVNARLVNGIDHFLELTGFEKALQQADVVVTGEGSIDEQTLQGKGPFGVAKKAKENGLPVIGLAGRIPLEQNAALQQYFDMLVAIGHQPTDLQTALQNTAANLERTAAQIGNFLFSTIHQQQGQTAGNIA